MGGKWSGCGGVASSRDGWYTAVMAKRFKTLAVAAVAIAVLTLDATGVSASGGTGHPYEACLRSKALALEPAGTEVSEVVAEAERACGDQKGGLSSAAAGEVSQKVRLAVMQQRSNARAFDRRRL